MWKTAILFEPIVGPEQNSGTRTFFVFALGVFYFLNQEDGCKVE